mgnify:CR=1 FL=1
MNTNEENKTENPESGIQTYDRKKKSHGNFLKIGCASCGFVAVVALCVLSSRYSWFGVKADDEGISYNNGLASSYSTTTPVEEQKVPTKANKHNEAQETTVATSTTTLATTTAKATSVTTTAKTTQTTAATTKATTPATTAAPKPAWTEKKCSATMYINISSCSARKEGLQGSKVVSYKYYGAAVEVIALTDTGYYKLDDGTYIHGDYLSETKPAETTTVTTTAKPTVQNSTTPAPVLTDSPVNCTAEEAEVFRIVNEIRVSYGLKPYKWDANAYKAAKARCSEIEQQFSHLRPDGSNFKTIYGYSDDELWYKFCSVGENLGSGQPTAQRVVDSWMASTKGHRENILNPDFENLAVAFGTYNDAYKYYWVQEFTTYR